MNDAFKALSDPTRRRILELLSERDMTAGEIAECFSITKPSVSHHLSTLKNAGLILDERQGQNILYSLNTTVFQEFIKWFLNVSEGGKHYEKESSVHPVHPVSSVPDSACMPDTPDA